MTRNTDQKFTDRNTEKFTDQNTDQKYETTAGDDCKLNQSWW